MRTQLSSVLLASLAVLTLGQPLAAGDEAELDEAEVFVEWNSTDGDFGIQIFWDGEGWDRMRVSGPPDGYLLNIRAKKNLEEQGLTEGFFESVEPDVDDLDWEAFKERFPEGEYEFEGLTLDGKPIEGETDFTHVRPAPPENLWPADEDEVNSDFRVIASFDAVTTDAEGNPLTPELYEVIVETEGDILQVFSVILKGDTPNPEVTIPSQFLEPETDYKLEIIVQEASGNRTISETEWSTL